MKVECINKTEEGIYLFRIEEGNNIIVNAFHGNTVTYIKDILLRTGEFQRDKDIELLLAMEIEKYENKS